MNRSLLTAGRQLLRPLLSQPRHLSLQRTPSLLRLRTELGAMQRRTKTVDPAASGPGLIPESERIRVTFHSDGESFPTYGKVSLRRLSGSESE